VLFEAFKTASLPNFLLLQQSLPKLEKSGKRLSTTASTPRVTSAIWTVKIRTRLIRRSPMARLWISVLLPGLAVALWGEPQSVQASASLLESGVDAHGVVVLNYGDFSVTPSTQSKRLGIASEIQGEVGIAGHRAYLRMPKGVLSTRGKTQDLTTPQHINTMLYEAEALPIWLNPAKWITRHWPSAVSPPNCNGDSPPDRRGFPGRRDGNPLTA
jgi:hypothetical protein